MENAEFKLSDKMRAMLSEGEEILWLGKAEPFPLLSQGMKKPVVLRWCICVLLAVLLTVAYVLLTRDSGFDPLMEALLIVVLAYISCVPIIRRSKVLKKCDYFVTDKRLFVTVGDKEVNVLDRAGLKIRKVAGTDGCATYLFNANTELPTAKYLFSTILPAENEVTNTGLTFYNTKDTAALQKLLPV